MTITSLNFFVFLGLTTFGYYLFPKKKRWILLLFYSAVFWGIVSGKVLGYFFFGTLTAYIGARWMDRQNVEERQKKTVLIVCLISELALLFVLKYCNIFPNTVNGLGRLSGIPVHKRTIHLVAPVGISYYTLSLWTYLADVYRTTVRAEKSYAKLLLFAGYYPCLVSGPVIRYPEMKQEFFAERPLDFDNLFMGFHRIVYGLAKKMVIADNLAMIVNPIFSDTRTYSGSFILVGVLLYAFQIYCDFSGCMDIVLGASRLYGIVLPENFNSPFFSKNLTEFWRRWHMSLGAWGKDYVMYPLLKSERFQRLGQWSRQKFGKKKGKKIPVITATFLLWIFIGVWHGATYRYIFAAGILPWTYLTCSELFGSNIQTWAKKMKITEESLLFSCFQRLRTLFFMLVIWLFASAPSFLESGTMIRRIFRSPDQQVVEKYMLEHIYPEAMIQYGIMLLLLVGVWIVDWRKYHHKEVGREFNRQPWPVRYVLLFGMLIAIMVYGIYGPGYDPAEFIYGGF